MSKESKDIELGDLSTTLQKLILSKGTNTAYSAVNKSLTTIEKLLNGISLTIDVTRPGSPHNDLNLHVNENNNTMEIYHGDAWHGTAIVFK